MRKINLKQYMIETIDETGKVIKVPYDVKRSIENILLATGPYTKQTLSMVDLLRNARIAEKVLAAKDFILIEEHEFQIIKESFEAFRKFGINEVELCKRIDEAETVEVKEKKQKKDEPWKPKNKS